MTKEAINLSIDTEVLRKAKQQIPNISQFVEECLKAYVGDNYFFNTSEAQEYLTQMKDAQAKLYILTQRTNIEESMKKAEKEKIGLTWRKLYKEYRDTKKINPERLEDASKILNVSSMELMDIIEVAYIYKDNRDLDITNWEEVYKTYGYGDS